MFSQTGFIINPNILVEKLVIEMSQKIAAGYLQFCSKTVEEMLENHVFFPPVKVSLLRGGYTTKMSAHFVNPTQLEKTDVTKKHFAKVDFCARHQSV